MGSDIADIPARRRDSGRDKLGADVALADSTLIHESPEQAR